MAKLGLGMIASLAVLLVGLASVVLPAAGNLPSVRGVSNLAEPRRTLILDERGQVLARLYVEDREPITLSMIPQHAQEAVIASEDRRFYQHNGVDSRGVVRAAVSNLKHGRIVEGGSTITQQYARHAFLGTEKTVTRKLRESLLAAKLESIYPKTKILELYFNAVYFGHGAYGIEVAAERFFGKKASALTLAEGALLAGLPKSPASFSPYLYPDAAVRRRAHVLSEMAEAGYITSQQADSAAAEPLRLRPLGQNDQVLAPYFVDYVKRLLIKKYGYDTVFKGGLRVYTTIDLKMQGDAERAVNGVLNRKGDPTAAVVAIEPSTGKMRAMVGGRDYASQKFNLAVQGKRQPGSAFKTFVLVAALSQGMSPHNTYSSSSPQVIPIRGSTNGEKWRGEDWVVNNYEGKGYGRMTIEKATVKSVNAVFAQLIMDVGPAKVVDAAKQMGIATPIDPFPAIAIGGLKTGVSPLDMASAYATLANRGVHVTPIAITRIEGAAGQVIETAAPKATQAVKPAVAARATQILREVIESGTGRRADIGRPAAGKTGTTQNYRDAWFIGYTPDLAAAVWIGYPQAQIAMRNVHGIRVAGGSFPAMIWQRFMSRALAGKPVSDFSLAPEEKGVEVELCTESRKLARSGCPRTVKVFLPAGEVPHELCNLHRSWRTKRTGRRTSGTQADGVSGANGTSDGTVSAARKKGSGDATSTP